jgi:hypothetical protein
MSVVSLATPFSFFTRPFGYVSGKLVCLFPHLVRRCSSCLSAAHERSTFLSTLFDSPDPLKQLLPLLRSTSPFSPPLPPLSFTSLSPLPSIDRKYSSRVWNHAQQRPRTSADTPQALPYGPRSLEMSSFNTVVLASFSFLPDPTRPIDSYFPSSTSLIAKPLPVRPSSPTFSSSSDCVILYDEREKSYGPERPPPDEEPMLVDTRAKATKEGKRKSNEEEEAVQSDAEDWFTSRFKRRRTSSVERQHNGSARTTELPLAANAVENLPSSPATKSSRQRRKKRRSRWEIRAEDAEASQNYYTGLTKQEKQIYKNRRRLGIRSTSTDIGGHAFEDSSTPTFTVPGRAPLPPPRKRSSSPLLNHPPGVRGSEGQQRRLSSPISSNAVAAPTQQPFPRIRNRSSPPPRTKPHRTSFPPSPSSSSKDVLSRAALFPSLRGLRIESYQPYLTDEPLELLWSPDYLETVLRLLRDCSDGATRVMQGTTSQPTPRDKFPAVKQIHALQPDKSSIREVVGQLGVSSAYVGLSANDHLRMRALRDTMRWVWEDEEINVSHAAWLVLEASRFTPLLPIYILRAFSSARFFSLLCDSNSDSPLPYSPRAQQHSPLLRRCSHAATRGLPRPLFNPSASFHQPATSRSYSPPLARREPLSMDHFLLDPERTPQNNGKRTWGGLGLVGEGERRGRKELGSAGRLGKGDDEEGGVEGDVR